MTETLPKKGLWELLEIISGEGCFSFIGAGLTSYPGADKNNDKLHAGCLELEKRGLIIRHLEKENYIVWMPAEQKGVTEL